MIPPFWLPQDAILKLHDLVIEVAGGASGLRDEGLLASALARPQNAWSYGEYDLCHLAALHAEGIARNHPFVDGNRRTAFQTASLFLRVNGLKLKALEDDTYPDAMVGLATGTLPRDSFADVLRRHIEES